MTGALSRRDLMRLGAGAALGLVALPSSARAARPAAAPDADALFALLDARIEAAMARHHVPGAAIAVLYRGREHVRGFGVTNVDAPRPVDGDTPFRIASTTKTFTGATVMRLVEQGRLDLEARVRRYLPGFRVADRHASQQVTLRMCLNHSSGWLGDDEQDLGRGDDALVRYVASLRRLPQLTPPGTRFAYNNAALDVVGRVIEVVTGQSYEAAVEAQLLAPLGLERTGFTVDRSVAAQSHVVRDGRAVPAPGHWSIPRSAHPDGGLISSARDQLRWARFLMGDGAGVLTPASLQAMRSHPGPGGTLIAEIDGFGVTLCLRRTAEGVRIAEHGGDYQGQHSGFLLVPDRDFAMTLLTNSTGGVAMKVDLFYGDWALRRFAGLRNPPAIPRPRSAERLREYAGRYVSDSIDRDGRRQRTVMTATPSHGRLRWASDEDPAAAQTLTFYRHDHVVVRSPGLTPADAMRANFVRARDGRVAWLSLGGRLHRHEPSH